MRRSLMAAAAGAVLALTAAPSVTAQTQFTLDVVLTAPKADNIYAGPVTTSGSVHAEGFQARIDWVKAELVWGKPGAPPPMPKPVFLCGLEPGVDAPPGPPCSGADFSFTDAPVPQPAFNGPYQLFVRARASRFNELVDDSAEVKYGVAVLPAKPGNVKASVNKDRHVTIGWDRNGEPDLFGYDIYRMAPGQTKFDRAIVRVLQPNEGGRVSVIDDRAPIAPGEYTYIVQAVRPGSTGDPNTSFTLSEHAPVKITLPAGNPSSTPPPTQPPKNPNSPPVVRGTPGRAPRLSSAAPATTPTTEAVTPDPGFTRDVPYEGPGAPDDEEEEGESEVAINESGGRAKSNTRGILIPAATGSILFVAALQLRWLKKRLEEPMTPLND